MSILLIVIQFFILRSCKKREKESRELYERLQSVALEMSQEMNEFETQMKEKSERLVRKKGVVYEESKDFTHFWSSDDDLTGKS
ncbi:MAG: hypothetical protein RRZ67_04565 [Victivallaceae bacterium]